MIERTMELSVKSNRSAESLMSMRKLLAFFCLVAVLAAAVTPVSAGLHWAVLIPLLFVFGTVAVWTERQTEENGPPVLACSPVISSRAPPSADPLI
jgi:hypothetical protein